ncbi:MAG: amidohydrolase family protein [Acidimicrobiia bacterium]|nr:amidohydrolase family protein [Acidimicrobiia bacterium]
MTPTPDVLLRAVEVEGARTDVMVADGRIAAIGDDLRPSSRDEVVFVDGAGGALLPGLHDHHVHLSAIAARRHGVDVDACDTPTAFDRVVADAVVDDVGWVRVGGHDEHRHGAVDRRRLDALRPGVAVRVQHRSGLAWTLSTSGLERIGNDDAPLGALERDGDGAPTGTILRADDWLARRLGPVPPPLDDLGSELAALGLTGVTDATVSLGAARLEALLVARRTGSLPQRLVVLGTDDEDLDGLAVAGPAKVLADEVRGLDVDALAAAIADRHAGGRAVAIHAVTRAENVAAATALAMAGPIAGDRIEHGSVLPVELDDLLARSQITVVVQPALVHERGDHHLDVVDAVDLPVLHRIRSLRAAGVPVLIGSDAPVTSIDPWRAIRAAVDRRTRSGAVVGPDEAITAAEALAMYLADPLAPTGPIRRVVRGAAADLVLLDAPLPDALADPDRSRVRHTWVNGRLVHP